MNIEQYLSRWCIKNVLLKSLPFIGIAEIVVFGEKEHIVHK